MPRSSYISVLRILAIFLVILIHSSSGYLNSYAPNSFDWNYANWINSFSRYAVPLFVTISGALLLQKDENIGPFYHKRLLKIVPPFLFWTVIYLIYYFIRYIDFELVSFPQVVNIVLIRLKSGSNAHLWYLYMLIGLYLAIPFLRKMIRNCSKREVEIFLYLWFAALFFTNGWLNAYLPNLDLVFFSGYIGYLVLGYYLYRYPITNNMWSSLLYFVFCCLITGLGTAVLSFEKREFDPSLYNYLSPNIALSTAFIFIFFQSMKLPERLHPFWEFIDNTSFGIYLCHILLLNYIHPLVPLSTLWKIPVAAVLTLLSSALLTYCLRKLPLGKYVSG
ncbi:acyltransferase family protein [Sphingobacterium sp. N143]|uniref:acyltransferase n=1 Tax=Sphingobacterium sp. N143 TaxID=2746727 RepID=UPI002576E49B|nr:acyltransferase family protein [Sphingobacterium sp. N143]MDM1293702.1 acyltransferase family protein [Sphingobacterium sp. N143]